MPIDCECIRGYVSNDLSECVDADECKTDAHTCDLDAQCFNTNGGFSCSCEAGYAWDGQACSDIDECSSGRHNCHEEAYCSNTNGSFNCTCILYGNGTSCFDNKCDAGLHNCHMNAYCEKVLFSTEGSFTCHCDTSVALGDGTSCPFPIQSPFEWTLTFILSKDKIPLIIDGKGQSREIELSFDTKYSYWGLCSIAWRGKAYIFGGFRRARQISVVDNCKLTNIGELLFDMIHGACTQRNDTEVFICFENYADSATSKNCRRATDPNGIFEDLPRSAHDHAQTQIAATSGQLLTVSLL